MSEEINNNEKSANGEGHGLGLSTSPIFDKDHESTDPLLSEGSLTKDIEEKTTLNEKEEIDAPLPAPPEQAPSTIPHDLPQEPALLLSVDKEKDPPTIINTEELELPPAVKEEEREEEKVRVQHDSPIADEAVTHEDPSKPQESNAILEHQPSSPSSPSSPDNNQQLSPKEKQEIGEAPSDQVSEIKVDPANENMSEPLLQSSLLMEQKPETNHAPPKRGTKISLGDAAASPQLSQSDTVDKSDPLDKVGSPSPPNDKEAPTSTDVEKHGDDDFKTSTDAQVVVVPQPPPPFKALALDDLLARLPDSDEMLADLQMQQSKETPPLFFAAADNNKGKYKLIEDIREEATAVVIEPYEVDFEVQAKSETLLIGSVSLEEVQFEERRLREEHLRYQQAEATYYQQKELEVLRGKEAAKMDLAIQARAQEQKMQALRQNVFKAQYAISHDVHEAYRDAEKHLLDALAQRKAEVKARYGPLIVRDGVYIGQHERKWRLEWSLTPQPIEVKILTAKGVRDKLPPGQYVVHASLVEMLGGAALRWSNLKGQEWFSSTLPVDHESDIEKPDIPFNQSLYTVCPSRTETPPGLAILFQIVRLRGAATPSDTVVGWGAFPLCDTEMDVIEGKFKTVLLKGPLTSNITAYDHIERAVLKNLDDWLCNLYFEISRRPRYTNGQREYEIDLVCSSFILGHPARDVEHPEDGDEPVMDIDTLRTSELLHGTGAKSLLLQRTDNEVSKNNMEASSALPLLENHDDITLGSNHEDEDDDGSSVSGLSEIGHNEHATHVSARNGVSYYTHHSQSVAEELSSVKRPKSVINSKLKAGVLDQTIGLFSYSVPQPRATKSTRSFRKTRYFLKQLFAEYSPTHAGGSRTVMWSLFCLLFIFWVRIFLHYSIQWLFLRYVANIPIETFRVLPVTFKLIYEASSITTPMEIGVVCVGPMSVFAVFLMLVLIAFICSLAKTRVPVLGSRFILAWGILTVFHPLFVLIVDLAYQRWEYPDDSVHVGDAFKLYWHFDLTASSSVPGVFLPLCIYFSITFLSMCVFYVYFVCLHSHGMILDVYRRITAPEHAFFFPFDYELSLPELGKIMAAAERWRGSCGDRRKVAVYEHGWVSQKTSKKPSKKETTVHISIHTIHLDGERELYRQFLCTPDGAIIELFGDVSLNNNIDARIKEELKKSHVDLPEIIKASASQLNDILDGDGDMNRGNLHSRQRSRSSLSVVPVRRLSRTHSRLRGSFESLLPQKSESPLPLSHVGSSSNLDGIRRFRSNSSLGSLSEHAFRAPSHDDLLTAIDEELSSAAH